MLFTDSEFLQEIVWHHGQANRRVRYVMDFMFTKDGWSLTGEHDYSLSLCEWNRVT